MPVDNPEQAVDQVNAAGDHGGAISDEVISIYVNSSPEQRKQIFDAGKNDPALMQEFPIVEIADKFLNGDTAGADALPDPAGVNVEFSNDGQQDVMIATEGNTRTYLGMNGDYQTFENLPGENGQPGTVKVDTNGVKTEIPGVTGYDDDGANGAPLITTDRGQHVVRAGGSVESTLKSGVQMTTDGSVEGTGGKVSEYKNPAAGIDIEVGPDGKTADGKMTNVNVDPDGTLHYTSDDGYDVTVSPDGKEERTREVDGVTVTETRAKPGAEEYTAEYSNGVKVEYQGGGSFLWTGPDGRQFQFTNENGIQGQSGTSGQRWGSVQEPGGDQVPVAHPPTMNPDGSIHFVQDGSLSDGSKRITASSGGIEND